MLNIRNCTLFNHKPKNAGTISNVTGINKRHNIEINSPLKEINSIKDIETDSNTKEIGLTKRIVI